MGELHQLPPPPPKATPAPRRMTQRYGLTQTANVWHIAKGKDGKWAKCGVWLRRGFIELPPPLQPTDDQVCRTCRGVVCRGTPW